MSASHQTPPSSAGAYADRLLAEAARAADGARVRLSGALNDLFRSTESRLNDRDHATMTRMLAALITAIERDMRGRLVESELLVEPEALAAELADAERAIAAPKLARSRVMRDPVLIALLLRRCEEHHIVRALHGAYSARGAAAETRMDRLTHHDNADIAEAAAAVLVAESRRLDRFGEPLLDRADLPVELQHRMTWWIAAALRDHMVGGHDIDRERVDRALVSAATILLEGYDDSETIDSRAYDLACRLRRERVLDDTLFVALLHEGQLAAWAAGLAVRAKIDSDVVWSMIADPDASRLTLLLRAIGMERGRALGMLADLFATRGGAAADKDARLAHVAAAFDALSIETARAAIRPWRPDDHFRRAVVGLALDEGPSE